MSRRKFADLRVTDGSNWWTVSGRIDGSEVILTRVHGDITDEAGLQEALRLAFFSELPS